MNTTLTQLVKAVQKIGTRHDFIASRINIGIKEASSLSPIFIIGAPRSGSTILYQFLIARFQLGYISNIMALAPCFMSQTSRLHRFCSKESLLKSNKYGYVSGLLGPNEAGALFRFWFDSELSACHTKKIRSTVWSLTKSLNGQLVSKNLYNSLRIKEILTVFPNARFLVINRDLIYNAQNLLLCRQKINGNITEWFSVRPPSDFDVDSLNPYQQVLWQVIKINEAVREGLEGVESERVSYVDYEKFCQSPKMVLDDIGKKLHLPSRPNSGLIDYSRIVVDQKKNRQMWNELQRTAATVLAGFPQM